jgi:uncharacterized protein
MIGTGNEAREKTTLVLGASLKPHRFSYKALKSLVDHGIPVLAVGLREGVVEGIKIEKPFPEFTGIHTVTLYVGPAHQPFYYDFIRKIKPSRIIFNPGTENEEFKKEMRDNGVEIVENCTLVMLAHGTY